MSLSAARNKFKIDSFTKTAKSGLLRKAIMENPQHPLWEMVK